MLDRFTIRFMTCTILVFVFYSSSLSAQSLPIPTVPQSSTEQPQVPGLDEKPPQLPDLKSDGLFSREFTHELLKDQVKIWTSPARVKASDAKWLVPLVAGTGFLFTQDTRISHHFDNKSSLQNASLKVGQVGLYSSWAIPGAFLAMGKVAGSDRMTHTGTKGLQAALYSQGVMHVMKLVSDRTRPGDGGNGHFWTGGSGFPSGHAMSAWAVAKVVSDEYSDKALIKIGMYSFATAVSLSRLTAERHYASDVLVGSAVGYLIGKFVMRNHHPAEAQ
jgi:PAP2 superfamily protein